MARKYSTDQDNYIDFNGSKLAAAWNQDPAMQVH